MKSSIKFHVKTRTILAIAGSVWMIAGVNVARLGIISYLLTKNISVLNLLMSFIVFGLFSTMFYKMSLKHANRIHSYKEDTKLFLYFFDLKAYCIMSFMMGFGIWLRSSGLVSSTFIAVFYTGLGNVLIFSGICFWYMYFSFQTRKNPLQP